MTEAQDKSLTDLLTELEIVDQAGIDEAVTLQKEAKEQGKEATLAQILVKKGAISYGLVERVLARLSNASLRCNGCDQETPSSELDPRAPFVCPSCGKPLPLPEREEEVTTIEDIVMDAAATVVQETLIGKTMAGCKVESKVGEGGMGAVYAATHQFLQRRVAVKVLPEYHVHQPGFVERFIRESRTAAQIIHPNVVQVMDAGRDGKIYYIIMEFVEGDSLEDILKEKGTVPLAQALEFARHAALGLGAAAEYGIIHRDIKPDNIRVSPKGIAKVADFGLAKEAESVHSVTMTGGVVGTPLYMSPEQAHGQKLDFRSDIYSLGATLYHLLVGRPPFEGGSAITILQKHAMEELPPMEKAIPGCPAEVNALVQKMMAKDREDRFQSYEELVQAIEEVEKGTGSVALTPARRKAPSGKSRKALPLAVVAILILGALGGWYFLGREKEGNGGQVVTRTGPTGPKPTGPMETGPLPTGPGVTGPGSTGPGATGPGATGPETTGPESTGPVEPPPPKFATVTITSDPDGATVLIGGAEIGVTPIDGDEIEPAEGTLRLVLENYEPYEETGIQLVAGEPFTRSQIQLQEILAGVRFTSTPDGAMIFLDERELGPTPLSQDDLQPGSHDVRAVMKGYEPDVKSFELVRGETKDVPLTLKALLASVRIETTPTGAQILMDGEDMGLSPIEPEDLAHGEHKFEARLAGYERKSWTLDLPPGEKTSHTEKLAHTAKIRDFLSGISKVEEMLKKGFLLRASAEMVEVERAGWSTTGLTQEEKDQASAVRQRVRAESPRITLDIRPTKGRGRVEGRSVLSATPKSARALGVIGRTFNVSASARAKTPLTVAVVRFSLVSNEAELIRPKVGYNISKTRKIPRLEDSKWTYPLTLNRRSGVELIVLVATPEDATISEVDNVRLSATRTGVRDPSQQGPKVILKFEEWLEGRGIDYAIRAAWIDMDR